MKGASWAPVLLTVVCYATLVVPFRASGLLEGPRWRGYLDQLVTTGLSPLRYYAGEEELRTMDDPDFPGIDELPIRPRVKTAPVISRPW